MPLLGWCLTGHHPNCPHEIHTSYDTLVLCSCTCHEEGRDSG